MFRKADRERLERLESSHYRMVNRYDAEMENIRRAFGHQLGILEHIKATSDKLHVIEAGLDKLLQSHAALEKQLQDVQTQKLVNFSERPNGKAKKAGKRP